MPLNSEPDTVVVETKESGAKPRAKTGRPLGATKLKISDEIVKQIEGLARIQCTMKEAGAVKTYGFGPVRETGWHLMGTTRMGDDPSRSVVNRNGETHDVPNLFIADSSVFVTSGGVNPTSTLQAVALRIADSIAISLGGK
jgi:choline dehydrogenase-like flavoprotein